MDLSTIMKAKEALNTFNANHPKFAPFIDAVKAKGIPAGAVIELQIKYPDDGGTMKTNIRVNESDLEMLKMAGSVLR